MSQRLRYLLDYLRSSGNVCNDADFAVKVDVPRSNLSEYIHGRRRITSKFVDRIVATFPDVNPEWLLDPECCVMIADGPEVDMRQCSSPVFNNNVKMHDQNLNAGNAELIEIIKKQQAQIDRLLTIIEKQQEQ